MYSSVLLMTSKRNMLPSCRIPKLKGLYILLGKGVHKLRKNMILNNCLSKFFRMVGNSPECKGSTVLDWNSRIQQEWPNLLENAERMQIIDILGLWSEICHLLRELYFSFLEILKGGLQCLHKVTKIYQIAVWSKTQILENSREDWSRLKPNKFGCFVII